MVSVCTYVCACLYLGVKASVGRGEKTQAVMFSAGIHQMGYTGFLSRPGNEPACSAPSVLGLQTFEAVHTFFLNMGAWDYVLLPYR